VSIQKIRATPHALLGRENICGKLSRKYSDSPINRGMELSIPLLPKESSLSSDWFRLENGSNAAIVTASGGRTETLIYVVFGDDFIAGLRVDRRTWILLPSAAVTSVTFKQLGASWLPPVRQTSEQGGSYLQGLGPVDMQIWPVGAQVALPPPGFGAGPVARAFPGLRWCRGATGCLGCDCDHRSGGRRCGRRQPGCRKVRCLKWRP